MTPDPLSDFELEQYLQRWAGSGLPMCQRLAVTIEALRSENARLQAREDRRRDCILALAEDLELN